MHWVKSNLSEESMEKLISLVAIVNAANDDEPPIDTIEDQVAANEDFELIDPDGQFKFENANRTVFYGSLLFFSTYQFI